MTRATAHTLDAVDPLARFAGQFARPPGVVYLDGNSLGLLCRPAEESLRTAIESWRELAIRGWTEGPEPWFGLSRKIAGLLAPLLGAEPADVMVGQTTTVNLHQLLATFYDATGERPGILIDGTAFPTDRYAVESHLRLRGRDPGADQVVVDPSPDWLFDEGRLTAAMTGPVGFAVLPTVVYTTGQLLDMPRLAAEARDRGVMIGWDCSHSADQKTRS